MSVQVQYKTPGVYVEEIDAFPPSIVGVETAVPVFIGYTEKASKGGRDMTNRPMRLGSLVEYEAVFGGAPLYKFKLVDASVTAQDVDTAQVAADAAKKAQDAADQDAAANASDQAKADAKKQADDAATKAAGALNDIQTKYQKSYIGAAGLKAKASEDQAEKDSAAASKDPKDVGLQQKAQASAAKAKLDRAAADAAADIPTVVVGGKPFGLVTETRNYFYNSIRLFYANGGSDCYVVSVGGYDAAASRDALKAGLDAVREVVGPTMLVMPEAVTLSADDHATLVHEMLEQCYTKQDRVAIIDVWGMDAPEDFGATVDAFRQTTIGGVNSDYLKYGMAYAPFLRTSIVDPTEVSFANLDGADQDPDFVAALKDEVNQLFPDKNPDPNFKEGDLTQSAARVKNFYDAQLKNTPSNSSSPGDIAKFQRLNQMLVTQIPVFKDIYAQMAAMLGTLPPSGAMAGIYTQIDATRGVWNAPANIGFTSVIGPTVPISNSMQEDLNVPINGYAVNAIRDFVGRGTLVWGARTLDGNSNDWRYIQVRRTLIYIEQSAELALNKFVFEPNVAQTWVTVSTMIGAFLRGLWSQGGLMGTTPEEAYSVQCGLGSTMTAQDVLEGRMIVQIKLQMVRPAEFIILTFKQQMQGGA